MLGEGVRASERRRDLLQTRRLPPLQPHPPEQRPSTAKQFRSAEHWKGVFGQRQPYLTVTERPDDHQRLMT